MKSIEEVISMLGEVERNEEQLLKIIFMGKHHEAAMLRKTIDKINHRFKVSCQAIVSDVHKADYADLNESMYIELETHFSFWWEKFNAIHEEAVKSLEELSVHQKKDLMALSELQQNIHPLMPKCTKQIQEYKEIELQLMNMNQ